MRWKIENEGFNVQKRGGYELEHAYTNHPNSAKVFYFLLQIAATTNAAFAGLTRTSDLRSRMTRSFWAIFYLPPTT
jgi:hypothetical protein